MKKTGLLLIALTTAAILSLSLIILYGSHPVQQQNSANNTNAIIPTPTPEVHQVKISQFSSPNGWYCPGGVAMAVNFDVAIQNLGSLNITNLTLLVKTTEENALSSVKTLNVTSGETVYTYVNVGTNINRYTGEFYNSTFTATISLNNVVLDEETIEITRSQF